MNDNQPNLIEMLGDDFLNRRRLGESPSISEYTEQHPDHAEQIRDFLEALEIVNKFKTTSSDICPDFESVSHLETGFPVIDDYRIIRQIGRGGMGVVFEARQISLDRRVALKILPEEFLKDRVAINRFLQEAKSAAALHHSNIVPVFDVGISDHLYFYTMQFIHGNPLDEVIVEIDKLLKNESDNDAGETARRRADVAMTVVAGRNAIEIDQENPPVRAGSLPPKTNFELLTGSSFSTKSSSRAFHSSRSHDSKQPTQDKIVYKSVVDFDDDESTVEAMQQPANETFNLRIIGDDTARISTKDMRPFYRGVARIGQQVASALGYAHAQGIVHRDIKPSNILLDLTGNAWVTDFGLAKLDTSNLTAAGDIVGTLRYMSPERLDGNSDFRCDIYSLGISLYELVACRPAFDTESKMSLMQQVRSMNPLSLTERHSKFPADLETIIFKAISKDPGHRYQHASTMADDLTRFIEGRPIKARRVSTLENLKSWARRNPLSATLVGTVCILAVLLTIASTTAAVKFRDMAITQARLSEETKASELLANQVSEENRRHLYYAEMQIVANSSEQPGGVDTARVLLEKWMPRQDKEDLRGWEWYWLWSRVNQEAQVVTLGGFPVELDFDTMGKRIAVVNENVVLIFDMESRDFVQTLSGFKGRVKSIRFSNDGTRLAASSIKEGRVVIWDLKTGKQLKTRLFEKYVGVIRWSRDDRHVAFVTAEKSIEPSRKCQLNIWDMKSGDEREVDSPKSSLFNLDFCATADLLATCTSDGKSVDIWDSNTWKTVSNRVLEGAEVAELRWNPNNKQLAILSRHSTVSVWDLDANQIDSISLIEANTMCLEWSPDGKHFAIGLDNGGLEVWNFESAELATTLNGHTSTCRSAAWSPDGQYLVSVGADMTMRIWSRSSIFAANSTQLSGSLRDPKLSWLDDSKLIVGAERTSWTIEIRDFDRAGFSPHAIDDCKLLCVNAAGSLFANVTNKQLVIRPCSSPEEVIHRWDIVGSEISCMAWNQSSDELMFAVDNTGSDSAIYVWNLQSNLPPQQIGTSLERVRALAWHPDRSQYIVATSSVGVFETLTGKTIQRLNSGTRSSIFVAWSPGTHQVAICGNDPVIRIFDANSWKLTRELRGHTNSINSLDWSNDGRQLVSGSADKTARIWSVEHNKTTLVMQHSSAVTAVKWDSRTNRLATLTGNGELSILNAHINAD